MDGAAGPIGTAIAGESPDIARVESTGCAVCLSAVGEAYLGLIRARAASGSIRIKQRFRQTLGNVPVTAELEKSAPKKLSHKMIPRTKVAARSPVYRRLIADTCQLTRGSAFARTSYQSVSQSLVISLVSAMFRDTEA